MKLQFAFLIVSALGAAPAAAQTVTFQNLTHELNDHEQSLTERCRYFSSGRYESEYGAEAAQQIPQEAMPDGRTFVQFLDVGCIIEAGLGGKPLVTATYDLGVASQAGSFLSQWRSAKDAQPQP